MALNITLLLSAQKKLFKLWYEYNLRDWFSGFLTGTTAV